MKKLLVIGVLMMAVMSVTACGTDSAKEEAAESTEAAKEEAAESAQTEYETYEFETFDGRNIVIDETNIVSQETVENVLETTKVPADAEVIAPGRDYVYLEDADFFYVEDAAKNLLTIANKDAQADEETADSSSEEAKVIEYDADYYNLSYKEGSFEEFGDEGNRTVTFSYCRDGIEMAGSNVITFDIVETVEAKAYLEEKVEAIAGDVTLIEKVNMAATEENCYVYTYGGESEGSELKTVSTMYCVPCRSGIIYIDCFRTAGPNEETENVIDSDFEYLMQSLVLK